MGEGKREVVTQCIVDQGGERFVKRICRYVFNDSKSAGLRPDRND